MRASVSAGVNSVVLILLLVLGEKRVVGGMVDGEHHIPLSVGVE